MTCSLLQLELSTVSDLWRGLVEQQVNGSVFLTPEWQQVWWERFGGGPRALRVLLIGDQSKPIGLAPMMREGDTLSFLGGTDLFDYRDFVFGTARPDEFYPALARCLGAEPWRVLDLESIREGSPTLQHLPDLFRLDGYEVSVLPEDMVPGVHLPTSWDEYLAHLGKKDRHELRRKFRRLSEAGEYRLVSSTVESLGEDVDQFLALMQESSDEKRDFLVPEREAFFRTVAARMMEEGVLRLFFLELNGQRVAAVVCFDYAGSRLLYNSGYQLAYRHYAVGLLLKALCVSQAIEEGLGYFDFLRGIEAYKYDLGGQDVALYRILVRR